MSDLLTEVESEIELELLIEQLEQNIWRSLRSSVSFQAIYTYPTQDFNILYDIKNGRSHLTVCFGNDVQYYWSEEIYWDCAIDEDFLIPIVKKGLLKVIKEHTLHEMIEVPKRITPHNLSVYQFKVPNFNE